MTELSPDGRALFASGRQGLAPNAEDSARNQERLAALLGSAAFAASGSMSPGALIGVKSGVTPWLGLSAKGLLKWCVLGAAVVIVGVGALLLRSSSKPKAALPLASHVSAASSGALLPPSPPAEPLSASAPVASALGATPARASQALAAPKHGLAEESRLLRKADAALRVADLPRALALLDEHAARFPHGVLAEERSLERISTLCKMGRVADAQLEFSRFGWTNSDSPLASAARSSCVK